MTILARNTLQQELQDVKHSLESADQSQLKASTHRQMATMFSRLSSFVAESSTPSASTLPDIWTSLTKAHTRAATRDMMTRVLRYDIMIGTWKAWRFLETECRQHCARALSASGSSSPWMRMLSTRIERYLQSAQPGSTLRLNSEEYVPIRNADPVVVEVLPCKQTLSDGELNTRVENEVVGILALWLQYPDSSQRSMPWRLQGPFINLLITLSGTQNVCYLTETWKAFTNVKASVFGDPNVRKVTKKHWDGLQKKAVPIAAAFRDSAGRKTLDEIQEVVGRFGGGGLKQEEYE
ncbi:hypothetical protein JAAARDRAFT_473180 [Jaapia argillacea MUCL 33604]|uniref:Uncharacterized protein n=1 Tax=Jaapia argillacea MUCL 33604 TaxID=933084 RepID=A0A067PCL6_9AGAM|nr:hypothetical protein JAAARDRAFT_473180 [Jaapia argillacea MUCL 33604]